MQPEDGWPVRAGTKARGSAHKSQTPSNHRRRGLSRTAVAGGPIASASLIDLSARCMHAQLQK